MLEIGFKRKLGGAKSFEYFMGLDGDIYRDLDGRKTLRFFVGRDGFFIKQHFGVGWKEILKNLIQLKLPIISAKTEYKAIEHLKKIQIDTMDVVGFSQQGFNPAKLQSFIITKEINDSISLEDYCINWVEHPPAFKEKQVLLEKVAGIVKVMHENGMNHRDLYICHFLMKKNISIFDECSLFMIDLHRSQVRRVVPNRWLVKDLAALYFSAMHIGLTRRDLLRFIKIYKRKPLRVALEEHLFWDKVKLKAFALDGMPDTKKIR